jgi:3-hydroxyisobutyrate dehydrogenase
MNAIVAKPRIAFFGLGTMGGGMARRLLGAGYEVSVYNRNLEKAAVLAEAGARLTPTPRDAARGADVLIAMLSDDVASREVWLGERGALAAASAGAIAIECSTLTVPWVKELAADCERKGLEFLDAPVSGTRSHAANGVLTFLVGGTAAVLEAARPVLAAMGKNVVHLGPTGAGAMFKLVNNFLCGVQAASLAEAFAVLERGGMDMGKSLATLCDGAAGSPLLKTLIGRHTSHDPVAHFQLRLMTKDLAYMQAEGKLLHVPLPCGAVALEAYNAAVAGGLGERDFSAIIEAKLRR